MNDDEFEFMDGCDEITDDPDKNTPDASIAALALYADIDFEDPDVVKERKAEWEALGKVGAI